MVSHASRQLPGFLCPSFGPGSAHNIGPRAAGMLVTGGSESVKD